MILEDNIPSIHVNNTQPFEKNTTLDSKGHLSRAQLYVVTAILSICVIGLSGYLIWNTYKQEFQTYQATQTNDSSEENDTSPEETQMITYQYSHDGDKYTLNWENPESLEFRTVQRETSGKTLIVELGSDVALEIYQKDNISETSKGGAYGDIISNVTDEIVRTGYFGHHYVLVVEEDMCSIPNQIPCVIVAFHNGPEGALSAYIRYPVTTGPEMLTYSEQATIADDLIRSYSIENGWEDENEVVNTSRFFHCAAYINSVPQSNQWRFEIEYPPTVIAEETQEDCSEIRFNYSDSFLEFRTSVGGHISQLDDDTVSVNEDLDIVRNLSFENTILEYNGRNEYLPQYYEPIDNSECTSSPMYPELHSPCGTSDVSLDETDIARVWIRAHIPTTLTYDEAEQVMNIFDEMVGSLKGSLVVEF